MTTVKFRKLHTKKKRILDEAEVKTRSALFHSHNEVKLAEAVSVRIHHIQGLNLDVAKDIKMILSTAKKPSTQRLFLSDLNAKLDSLAKTQGQVLAILKDMKAHKKTSTKNVRALLKDFKKISKIHIQTEKNIA